MSVRLTIAPEGEGSQGSSWLVDVNDSTTVAELAESIQVPATMLAPRHDASATLVEAGVLSGARLPSVALSELEPGTPRLEVVGGPFSGETVALTAGAPFVIGSSAECDLCIADPHVALRHARLTLNAAEGGLGATLEPETEESAVYVDGEVISGTVELVPANVIQVGSSVFRIGIEPYPDADLAPGEAGLRAFNRPSRIVPPTSPPTVVLPGERPEEGDKTPLPWLSALIPVVLGVTMAFVFNRPIMLMMAAASPVMVIGTFLTNRARAKKKGIRTFEQWAADIRSARERIAHLVRKQRLDDWYRRPDPVVLRDIATRPLSRLWERRKVDADSLQLRIGVTEVPLAVRFEGGGEDRTEPRKVGVAPVPVAADLASGVVGIAGPADVTRSLTRSMLLSLAALRSPRDAQVIVLCDESDAAEWEWATWLPHAHAGSSVVALIGNTEESRRERLRDVSSLIGARSRAAAERGASGFDTHIIVVVDGARRFRTLPGFVQMLETGGAVDVHVVALDSDRSRLPEEARTVIEVDVDDRSLARVESSAAYHPTVLLDGVSIPLAERVARSLCSIKHVGGVGDEAMLPTAVRYAELLDIDLDDPRALAERWQRMPRRTNIVVGAGLEGQFALDIAVDGPHALVAGTTGAGKSEFLQTLIISLAMANRPDALNFVLVDYKGASAFADCERLPHTVGMVTNLDARETERALVSLDAEIKRRESVLRDLGAKDIDAAWSKNPAAAASGGLARLMIVIDEFAELKTEHPEFINGLVRIARVGRSLGIHLILATQRPSGVITPEMQSNINLRVALRVTDRADSADVLGSVEASLISVATPGRGYVRSGVGTAPVAFQTARVAGVRPGVQRVGRTAPPAAPITWQAVGHPPRFPAGPASEHGGVDHDDTDLRALVELVGEAARILEIPRNPSPWLMPLPTVAPITRIDVGGAGETAVIIGLEDVPDEQTQRPLTWDVANDMHVLVIGSAMSGRTTFLRTVLGQVVSRFSPTDAHLYVIDYGNGGLLPLTQTPHTGAVVTSLEPSRLQRLMARLIDELQRRQAILSAAGVGGVLEQRRTAAPGAALPFMVIAIDGWERVTSTMSPEELPAFRDQMLRILREGPAVGVRVVMTADRTVSGDKVSGFIDRQYVLPLRDVNDYRSAGVMIRELPESLPPGRVLFGPAGREAQVAIIGRDAGAEAQGETLRTMVRSVEAFYAQNPVPEDEPRPFRVDALPRAFTLADAVTLPLASTCTTESPVVAVGGDELSRYTVDWFHGGGFSIIGDRGVGKSTALATIGAQLVAEGHPVLAVAVRRSPLAEWAGEARVSLIDSLTVTSDQLEAFLPASDAVVSVLVDDVDAIKDSAVERWIMERRARFAFGVSLTPDASTKIFGGPFGEVRKAQSGMVLSPSSPLLGTQVFGSKIPKYMLGRTAPGGGVLFHAGEWMQSQVPDPGLPSARG